MTRILVIVLFLAAAALPLGDVASAAEPDVRGVGFAQRTDGSQLVDVHYRLDDADGDTLTVTLQISADDGATWHVPATQVSGDVGPGVLPGVDKQIVWDLGADLPGSEGGTFRVRVVASDEGVDFATHSPHLYAIFDWTPVDWTVPGTVERFARADLICLTASEIWGRQVPEDLRIFERIKAINPDCVIIGYMLAKTVHVNWGSSAQTYPFGYDLYQATLPYWCYTTTGDTLQDWFKQVNVNILEPGCRTAIASTIQHYRDTSVNRFDGVFWDYFASSLWWPVDTLFEGEPDLDGDGVPHHQDPDEMAAYRQACVDLVTEVRTLLGEDFIQVFNGPRAQIDPGFAALSDGIHYELFPTLAYQHPNMANALDPDNPTSLFQSILWPRTNNGGPYNLVTNIRQVFYNDTERVNTRLDQGNLNRVVGLLTGVYASWNSHGGYSYGWPEVDISLGEPLGPTVIDGPVHRRDFQYGSVEMIMGSGEYPVPFSYEIRIGDRIVEAFDFPYHFP